MPILIGTNRRQFNFLHLFAICPETRLNVAFRILRKILRYYFIIHLLNASRSFWLLNAENSVYVVVDTYK